MLGRKRARDGFTRLYCATKAHQDTVLEMNTQNIKIVTLNEIIGAIQYA